LFHVPGTAKHAEIVYTIQSYLKAAGVGILADIVGAENFADDWAFRRSSQDRYNVYVRESWHGIPVWIPHMETMLRTLGLKHRSAMNTSVLTVAAISRYVYRRRFDLFGDELLREALERLAPREMFSKTTAERAKLQRRIERNEEREFKFPTDAIFDQVLGELSADPTAKFRMDGEWATRICLQHRRFIRADTGRERFRDFLYYRDDEGSWNGPWVDWGLLPNERFKNSKIGNIEILNALDARLRRRRREVDEQEELALL